MALQVSEHIKDPTRIAAAQALVRPEALKLLTMGDNAPLKGGMSKIVRTAVEAWSQDTTRFPLRDFWNGIHGIMMGFRLVPSLPWLTSEDVTWSYADHPVDGMEFGTILTEFQAMERKPTVVEARQWLQAPEQQTHLATIKQRVKDRADRQPLGWVMPPLILQQTGELAAVADGNNRLLWAIVTGQPTLPAHLGRLTTTPPSGRPCLTEDWVPTSTLMDLIFTYRVQRDDPCSINDLGAAIARLVKFSQAGRYELVHRATNYRNPDDTEVVREAIRYLPESQQAEMLAAWTNGLRQVGREP